MTAIVEGPDGPPSPYVGPRAFREREPFCGRERESAGLVSRLIAGRIVLLHSPSGAGKTSLIQAAVAPAMAKRGFQLCARLEPRFSALRVNAPPPTFPVANRYVFSVVCGLVGDHVEDIEQLGAWTIDQALQDVGARSQQDSRQLLVFDQFEEILTLDPTDQSGQREFFEQVGDALDQPGRWALFAMREDYMGGLDRYLRYVPGQFRSTFRLDLLEVDAARRAVQLPAEKGGVDFEAAAADALVDKLRRVKVESPDTGVQVVEGSFVEPVLLQVVCDNLWRALTRPGFRRITTSDVDRHARLDDALGQYYESAVRYAARSNKRAELAIRDWVEEKLLTDQNFRSQTRLLPQVENVDDTMRRLQKRYLVRDDPRSNPPWWELSHDQLISPVVSSNRQWRKGYLKPWQIKARDWNSDHQDRHLLDGAELAQVNGFRRRTEPSATEVAFLEKSREAAAHAGRLRLLQARMGGIAALLVVSIVLNIVLLVYFLRR